MRSRGFVRFPGPSRFALWSQGHTAQITESVPPRLCRRPGFRHTNSCSRITFCGHALAASKEAKPSDKESAGTDGECRGGNPHAKRQHSSIDLGKVAREKKL